MQTLFSSSPLTSTSKCPMPTVPRLHPHSLPHLSAPCPLFPVFIPTHFHIHLLHAHCSPSSSPLTSTSICPMPTVPRLHPHSLPHSSAPCPLFPVFIPTHFHIQVPHAHCSPSSSPLTSTSKCPMPTVPRLHPHSLPHPSAPCPLFPVFIPTHFHIHLPHAHCSPSSSPLTSTSKCPMPTVPRLHPHSLPHPSAPCPLFPVFIPTHFHIQVPHAHCSPASPSST